MIRNSGFNKFRLIGLFGVFETRGSAVPGRELGVFSLISRLDITLSGSNGIISVH